MSERIKIILIGNLGNCDVIFGQCLVGWKVNVDVVPLTPEIDFMSQYFNNFTKKLFRYYYKQQFYYSVKLFSFFNQLSNRG